MRTTDENCVLNCDRCGAFLTRKSVRVDVRRIASTLTTSFYGYDGHGSVRSLTSSTGAVTDDALDADPRLSLAQGKIIVAVFLLRSSRNGVAVLANLYRERFLA